jgi:sulfite reductase (ferredoxin)
VRGLRDGAVRERRRRGADLRFRRGTISRGTQIRDALAIRQGANVTARSWKEALAGRIAPALEEEIDIYERQIRMAKEKKIDEKVLAETRLRRGTYGQRYDNGRRHDGAVTHVLEFPCGDLKKGPDTVWDAPGMQRIKIPFGGLNAAQMETLADVAEEYSDAILHVTTRQDIQLHYVHIEDTPDIMRRLAAVEITTRESCGNTVRNVTGCAIAGVCKDEEFDTTPYAKACARFLLGHKDTQDMGRKFKVSFSGCAENACALARLNDIGAVARIRDGRRGFALYVGGGLGPVPYQAKLFDEFVPEEDLLPTAQALCRIFSRLGERKNRARARFKFVVDKLGIEEIRRLVAEERKIMPREEAWTNWIAGAHAHAEEPLKEAGSPGAGAVDEDYSKWSSTNVRAQKQKGYFAVTVTLPLGDVSSRQMRRLADMARKYCRETIRTTIEQNILFRWVAGCDVGEFHAELKEIGLAAPGAETIVDIASCPGTDTCKLGIASSRGLAAVLRERLAAKEYQYNEAVRDMRIKISGCFNSCGQHHVAELGFYGTSRKVSGYAVPHFQIVLGGKFRENAGAYGLAIGNVPSKNVPAVVDRYLDRYLRERSSSETFRDFYLRLGRKESKIMVEDLLSVPAHDENPDIYRDWGKTVEFTLADMGRGECAGEVVSVTEFDLSAAEREAFEAQLILDEEGNAESAIAMAYKAMLTAARGLIRAEDKDAREASESVVSEFRARFYHPGRIAPNFAQYLFLLHEARIAATAAGPGANIEQARQRIEETQLFIEAAHGCYNKMLTERPAGSGS